MRPWIVELEGHRGRGCDISSFTPMDRNMANGLDTGVARIPFSGDKRIISAGLREVARRGGL
jgi:hypothetical protein